MSNLFSPELLARRLESTRISAEVQTISWIIPLTQAVHILAIALLLSSILMLNLRLWRSAPDETVGRTALRHFPRIWTALVLLAATGGILIIGEPERSLPNPTFQLKIALLALAVGATRAFEISIRRRGADWEAAPRPRLKARVFAAATSFLWLAIAIAGRLIAYTAKA